MQIQGFAAQQWKIGAPSTASRSAIAEQRLASTHAGYSIDSLHV